MIMMATSPVVTESATAPVPIPAKIPLVTLIIAILVAVVLGIAGTGGALFYLLRSGRLPLQKTVAAETRPVAPTASRAIVLDPMVANLADAGGAAYLKLSLTLLAADELMKKDGPKAAKGISTDDAAVRDTVLMVVGQQTANELLAQDGKQRLKSALKAALAEHNPELKVMDLYFTDFLVQR
ncbi:flagellar basal body-associated FliL family protein [Granulicella arctica]|uniref:Flagellar protein FliL n=1 Tax=Granulicella arctica TaxID=940613 RepID=A0A7Y9PI45_9BACT|nr:flagellar basal body-associated FliL family protein [Granulicella arctica]NYF80347.1 flagellar FliL protein [Granulicella arctica]